MAFIIVCNRLISQTSVMSNPHSYLYRLFRTSTQLVRGWPCSEREAVFVLSLQSADVRIVYVGFARVSNSLSFEFNRLFP